MLTFDEATHVYRYGGVKIPSVSELCNRILGSSYDDVPEEILKNAADFGTEVHRAIEFYNRFEMLMDLPPAKAHCLNEWLKLADQIQILESEKMGHYKGLFGGTMDAIGIYKGKKYLIDFKTTSMYMREKNELQLSLYRLIEGWEDIEGLLIVWLPKRSYGRLVEVESWDQMKLMKSIASALKVS